MGSWKPLYDHYFRFIQKKGIFNKDSIFYLRRISKYHNGYTHFKNVVSTTQMFN